MAVTVLLSLNTINNAIVLGWLWQYYCLWMPLTILKVGYRKSYQNCFRANILFWCTVAKVRSKLVVSFVLRAHCLCVCFILCLCKYIMPVAYLQNMLSVIRLFFDKLFRCFQGAAAYYFKDWLSQTLLLFCYSASHWKHPMWDMFI